MRSITRCFFLSILALVASSASGSKLPETIKQQIQSIPSPGELYVFAYRREETDPETAIAAYNSILERFPSSDIAIKATERIDRLKGAQPRETVLASAWRGRVVHFSEWFTYKVSTGSGLLDVLGGGGLSEKFEVTFEAVVEDELGSDLKVVVKSAKVSGGEASIMGIEEARRYSREVISSSIGRVRVLSKTDISSRSAAEAADTANRFPSRQITKKTECKSASNEEQLAECVSTLLLSGLNLLDEGHSGEARSAFEEAMVHADIVTKPMILAGIAQAFYLEGQHDRATELFKEAFELNPGNSDSRGNLVGMLVNFGRYSEAEKYAQGLHGPRSARLLTYVGQILYHKREIAMAIVYFDRAVAADPLLADPHYHAAVACLAQGRNKEAITHLKALLKKAPNHAQATWAREALSELTGKSP